MIRRGRAPLTDAQMVLWAAFLDCYLSTACRPAVDVFLRGLLGAPAKETP